MKDRAVHIALLLLSCVSNGRAIDCIFDVDVVTKYSASDVSSTKDDGKEHYIFCHLPNGTGSLVLKKPDGQDFVIYGPYRNYNDGFYSIEIAIDDYAEALSQCTARGYKYVQPYDGGLHRFEIRTNNKDGSFSPRFEVMPGTQQFGIPDDGTCAAFAQRNRITKPSAICNELMRRRKARRALLTTKPKQTKPKYKLFCSNCNKSMEKTAKTRMGLNCDFHTVTCPCAQSICRGMNRVKTPVCNATRYHPPNTIVQWAKFCRKAGCKYVQADTGDRTWYIIAYQRNILPGQYRIGNKKKSEVHVTATQAQFCGQFTNTKAGYKNTVKSAVKKASKVNKYKRTTRTKANAHPSVPRERSRLQRTTATKLKRTKQTRVISTRQRERGARKSAKVKEQTRKGRPKPTAKIQLMKKPSTAGKRRSRYSTRSRLSKTTRKKSRPSSRHTNNKRRTKSARFLTTRSKRRSTRQKPKTVRKTNSTRTKKPARNAKTTMPQRKKNATTRKRKLTSKQKPTNITRKLTTTRNKKKAKCTGNRTRCDDPIPTDPPYGYLYGDEHDVSRYACNLCSYCSVAPFPYDGKIEKPTCFSDRFSCTCPDCPKKDIDVEYCGLGKPLPLPHLSMLHRCGIYACKGVVMLEGERRKLIMIGGTIAVAGGLKNAADKEISVPAGTTEKAVCDLIGDEPGQYIISESMEYKVICTYCDNNDTKAIRLYPMRTVECKKFTSMDCTRRESRMRESPLYGIQVRSCVVTDTNTPSEKTISACKSQGCLYAQVGLFDSPQKWYLIQRLDGQFQPGVSWLDYPITPSDGGNKKWTMSTDTINKDYNCGPVDLDSDASTAVAKPTSARRTSQMPDTRTTQSITYPPSPISTTLNQRDREAQLSTVKLTRPDPSLLCSRCDSPSAYGRDAAVVNIPSEERSVKCTMAYITCVHPNGHSTTDSSRRKRICVPTCAMINADEYGALLRLCQTKGCETPQVRMGTDYYPFLKAITTQSSIESGVVRLKDGAVYFVLDRPITIDEFCNSQGDYILGGIYTDVACLDTEFGITIPPNHPKMYSIQPTSDVPYVTDPGFTRPPPNAVVVCTGCDQCTGFGCERIIFETDGVQPLFHDLQIKMYCQIEILECFCRDNAFVDGVCLKNAPPPDQSDQSEKARQARSKRETQRAKRGVLRNPEDKFLPKPNVEKLEQAMCDLTRGDFEQESIDWEKQCKSFKCAYPQAMVTTAENEKKLYGFKHGDRVLAGAFEAPTGGYRLVEHAPMKVDEFCRRLKVDNGKGGEDDWYPILGSDYRRRAKKMQ